MALKTRKKKEKLNVNGKIKQKEKKGNCVEENIDTTESLFKEEKNKKKTKNMT